MTQSTIWTRIVRYLTGEGSGSDTKNVRTWAASKPERQELLSSLEEIWDDTRHRSDPAEAPEGWDVEVGWARLQERRQKEVEASGPPVLRLEPPRRRRIWTTRLHPALRVAASFVLFLGAGVLGSKLYVELSRPGDDLQTFSTEPGQRATLRLGDGTNVSIGPATRVEILPSFRTGEERAIRLTGIAYFDVEPNPERPFIVLAGATRTQVVGTEFGIRAHSDDDVVEVVVAEGEVHFSGDSVSSDGAVALTPGLRGTFSRTGASIVTDPVDVEEALGWRTGRLAFDDQPLTEVVRELERWFAIDFRIADAETGARRFSGAFGTESVREIVDILMVALEVSYTRQGEVITFQPALSRGGDAPTPTR